MDQASVFAVVTVDQKNASENRPYASDYILSMGNAGREVGSRWLNKLKLQYSHSLFKYRVHTLPVLSSTYVHVRNVD